MIRAVEDRLHAPSGDRDWEESFTFDWGDDRSGLFGLTRISLNWARRSTEGVFVAIHDGQPLLVHRSRSRLPADFPDELVTTVSAGPLSYTIEKPLRLTHITLDTPNPVSLTWRSVDGAVGLEPADDACGERRGFIQLGGIEGAIGIAGNEHRIQGRGHRSKEWGRSGRSTSETEDRFTGRLAGGFAFDVRTGVTREGQHHAGVVHIKGRPRMVDEVVTNLHWSDRGHQIESVQLSFRDVAGDRYELIGHVVSSVPISWRGRFVDQAQVSWEWASGGGATPGQGRLEHLHRQTTTIAINRFRQVLATRALSARAAQQRA